MVMNCYDRFYLTIMFFCSLLIFPTHAMNLSKYIKKIVNKSFCNIYKKNNFIKTQIRYHSRDVIRTTFTKDGTLGLINLFQYQSSENEQIIFLTEFENYFLHHDNNGEFRKVYEICTALREQSLQKCDEKTNTTESCKSDSFWDYYMWYLWTSNTSTVNNSSHKPHNVESNVTALEEDVTSSQYFDKESNKKIEQQDNTSNDIERDEYYTSCNSDNYFGNHSSTCLHDTGSSSSFDCSDLFDIDF